MAARTWLTWPNLGVDRDERAALRRAGVAPSDLLTLAPMDLVAATDEVVTEARAEALIARASLLAVTTRASALALEAVGIRTRAELAAASADDLFLRWQDVSPFTNPLAYEYISKLIRAGGGSAPRRDADDLVRTAWQHRFAPAAEPVPTKVKLAIASIGVKAKVALGDAPPRRHDEVAVDDLDRPRTIVGHWQWAGHRAAFLRLEHAHPGDAVVLGERELEVVEVRRGPAPLTLLGTGGATVLSTPPHLRWPDWLRDWDLPPGTDLGRIWVQVAALAVPT